MPDHKGTLVANLTMMKINGLGLPVCKCLQPTSERLPDVIVGKRASALRAGRMRAAERRGKTAVAVNGRRIRSMQAGCAARSVFRLYEAVEENRQNQDGDDDVGAVALHREGGD